MRQFQSYRALANARLCKVHQVFMHLASFFQNSINANKIELGEYNFDTKTVVTAIKLASKFFSKMQKHIDNNSVPKDVQTFARGFFVDATEGGFVHTPAIDEQPPATKSTQPAEPNPNGKRKPNGEEQEGSKKKPRKEFSDKSLMMGLFHIKKEKHRPLGERVQPAAVVHPRRWALVGKNKRILYPKLVLILTMEDLWQKDWVLEELVFHTRPYSNASVGRATG